VIFVTARVNDEDEQHGLSLGPPTTSPSRCGRPSLLARIRNHLKLKQAQDALRDYNTALESSVAERTATLSAVLDSADQHRDDHHDGAIMAINRIGAEQFDLCPLQLAGCNLFDLLPSRVRLLAARSPK
jgi:response regulator RpfG family c-di-GMP phosphodiesterase